MTDQRSQSPAFCRALEWLLEGHRVARSAWMKPDGADWVELMGRDWPPTPGVLMKIATLHGKRVETPWRAASADLLAEDWVRLDRKPSLRR